MNTNSKHYEELNIQPWEIMERNFTTEEFVAYLKGNIIKYTLRDKGQDLTDAEKIKHYAEKLIEVLEKKETDEFLKEDAERIYGKAEPKKTLEPNKWYDAETFTEEELKELLPVGTKIVVTTKHDNDRDVDFETERLLNTLVKKIGRRPIKHETRIGVTGCCFWRRYFKIAEEY